MPIPSSFEQIYTPTAEQRSYWKQREDFWVAQGRNVAVFFGRFQPLHNGHTALFNAVRLMTGMDIHVVLNKKVDTADERNPYSPEQKKEMFRMALPWISERNLHTANVYLGGGGDVGFYVEKLATIYRSIAPENRVVLCYGFKKEDQHDYLVNGETFYDCHYMDLMTNPRRFSFAQQVVEADVIPGHVPIDAKLYRKDRARVDLLHPDVADYLAWQHYLADLNHRKVGASQTGDLIAISFDAWRDIMERRKGGGLLTDHQEMKMPTSPEIAKKPPCFKGLCR